MNCVEEHDIRPLLSRHRNNSRAKKPISTLQFGERLPIQASQRCSLPPKEIVFGAASAGARGGPRYRAHDRQPTAASALPEALPILSTPA